MQIIQQQPAQKINETKLQGQGAQADDQNLKTFTNPICKSTYSALPRIYGKKKRPNRAHTQPSRTNRQQLNNNSNHSIRSKGGQSQRKLSLAEINSAKKTISLNSKKHTSILNKTPHPKNCTKKSCGCRIQLQKMKQNKSKGKKQTFVSSIVGHIKLPQIQKFQLQDLQSKHKVSLQNLSLESPRSISVRKTGLNRILQQKAKQKQQSKSNSPLRIKQNLHRQQVSGRQIFRITKINMKYLKTKNKFKAKFNHPHRFDIQQESDQYNQNQYQYQDQSKSKQFRDQKLSSINSIGLKTQVKSFYPNGSHSMILNQSRFNKTKSNLTQLNLRQTQTQLGTKKRKSSSKQNGVYKIPVESQYLQYLKDYEKIHVNFDLATLLKKDRFRIIKAENQVYFGQVNSQQERHGEGINISQKQIYQGKYHKNLKFQGCQRNLDGVFAGKYQNGLRQGYGLFKWYNGQYFQGNWKNGVKNGFGKWKSPKGDFYEGQWVQNRQQGKGIFKHRTSTYKGQFVNFLKHGYGEQIFANGDHYKGQYKQGKPSGHGRYEWSEGGFYDGQFVKGMRQGKGKWVIPRKFDYEGFFKKDFKHGIGKQTYPNGQSFEGQFEYGQQIAGKLYDRFKNCKQIKRNKAEQPQVKT